MRRSLPLRRAPVARRRMYDPARFAAVARLLETGTGLPIVLIGNEREISLGDRILDAAGTAAVSLVGRTTVPESVAVIRRAALLVGCHSGPLHMADACGCPMVILFSGTDLESQWRPRHAPARLLYRATDCAPCYRFRCPYNMECLDIPPEDVAAEAVAMLERTTRSAV